MARKISTEERDNCARTLIEFIKGIKRQSNGSREVYTTVTTVARSGMSRRIKVFMVVKGELYNVTYRVGAIVGWHVNDDGIKVDGCGMDIPWHLVNTLEYYLYEHYGLSKKIALQKRGV